SVLIEEARRARSEAHERRTPVARPSPCRVTRGDGTPRVSPGVYLLDREASPQFASPVLVRVIRELIDRHPPYGWTWVDCYQLDRHGDATEKRQLFVMPQGMRQVDVTPVPYAARRPPPRSRPARAGG
ncbi:hypothetical protein, partial [Micromonospora andamanensis]|uniref:hypothetical protein n=1 Tax=Micromonospora andamanensis TaxID=1287068 RepID=UPI00363F27D3